jgi:hypothetical protein
VVIVATVAVTMAAGVIMTIAEATTTTAINLGSA